MSETMQLVPGHQSQTVKKGKSGRVRINKFTKEPILNEFPIERRIRMAQVQLGADLITKSIKEKSQDIWNKIRLDVSALQTSL
jgi:hypothetical protein